MKQFKSVKSLVTRTQNLLRSSTTQQQHKHTFFTTSFNTADQPVGWDEAKPLSECPTATPFEMIRGFLPGGKYYKMDTTAFFHALLAEKGDNIYLPGVFGKRNMFITQNPDDFEIVFRSGGIWPERRCLEVMNYHRNVLRKDYFGENSGLVTTQGKLWGDIRTLVNPILLHPKNVKIYLPSISKVNQEFIECIKKIRDPVTLEVPENFKDDISNWTMESISVVALDRQLGLLSSTNSDGLRISRALLRFFELSADLEIKHSIWRHLPNRKLNEAMDMLDIIMNVTDKYVTAAVKRLSNQTNEEPMKTKPEDERSVLERLININKKTAQITAMDMLLGGIDTTTTTFVGLLLCLAKHPVKQEILRKEILKILPHKDSPLTVENMKNLPYLRACLKEALRVYPLATNNVRTTSQNFVLSGYRVPKGSEVLIVSLNLLDDPKHFSNPNEFIPERWLRQSRESANLCPQAVRNNHPFVYLPFGYGPRSCIGRRIAEIEMEVGVVRLLRNFKMEFNHSVKNAFRQSQINVPAIPLKFKFIDLTY